MRFISPLRYPGGKAKLGPYFARILASQPATIETYAEPYAGGVGAGLHLLAEGHISHLMVNDLNPGIAALWRCIIQQPDEIIERIQSEDVSLDAWHRHRDVYLNPADKSDLDLGFSTFFLNRCNRSGILTARPIGGLDQSGKWKIDARFNRAELAARIRKIGSLPGSISVSEKPALDFLAAVSRRVKPVLLYVDPPYLVKGEELYMSSHSWSDHEKLAEALSKSRHPWILTYDVDDRVRSLYPSNRCLRYSISHTAQTQKVGREFMLFSRGLRVDDVSVASSRVGSWVEPDAQAMSTRTDSLQQPLFADIPGA
ncbi:DNA adenine methylase [Micromonospora sp. M61]|uniref:DNA adenine methylase n=1 Tax=Micromonospora sp. M61 TaxID=2824890 RepID=UPI001B39B5AF|nr:DNA adenine methylase [Micromonospora sp. M61]MBQ0977567.1 DNA adenine methylase [Micromonospora sp. M61]